MKGSWVLGAFLVIASAAHASGEFIWPNTGKITSTHVYPNGSYHSGSADIANASWTKIGASRAGKAYAMWQAGGGGYMVKIIHSSGYDTIYAHMVKWPSVGGGQWVSKNQLIGYVGSTGNSTGPHCHYAIRRWGNRLKIPNIWIGKWVTRGNVVPGTYPGLSGTTTSSSKFPVRVLTQALNVRTGPGTGYSVKGQVHYGQVYLSFSQSNGWHKIWYDGSTGWVYGGYAKKITGVTAVKVNVSVLNVRSGPGTGYADKGNVYSGQYYVRSGVSGSWYKIFWKGGQFWVHGSYVTKVGF